MNKINLLPRNFRIVGLALVILCFAVFTLDPEIVFGEQTLFKPLDGALVIEVFSLFDTSNHLAADSPAFYSWVRNDISNEILLTIMLIGTYFIAFSRVRGEDEFSKQLRNEAMSQAIVYNCILLLVLNWLFYEGLFLYVMISQLFSFLLIFSLVFALKIRRYRKMLSHEE